MMRPDRFWQGGWNWLLPSIPAIIFLLVFYDSLLFMPQMLNAGDGDLGRHLTAGRVMVQTGQILTRDIFSSTMAGADLIPHEWLSQVLFALVDRAAGLNGVAWLTALVFALTFALLAFGIQASGVPAPIAGVAAYTASIVASIHKLPRPHIFSWLCFMLALVVLEDYRRTHEWRKLLLLLPLIIVWANLHGAFIMGLMLVWLYAVGALFEKQFKRGAELCGLFLAMLGLACVNPVGWQLVVHSVGYLQSRWLIDLTVEYASPNFHALNVFPFAALLLFSLVAAWRSRRQLEWTPIIVLTAWTAFALYSARNIPLYAIVAVWMLTPIVVEELALILPRVSRVLVRLDYVARATWGWHWAVLGAVALIVLNARGMNFDVWGQGNRFDPKVFPVAAMDRVIDGQFNGKLFNALTWGGYILYRGFPAYRVFIDGQTDFYGEALSRDYLQIIQAMPGWDAQLMQYDVQWVIIPPSVPLATRLDESPAWTRQYRDDTAGVWVRR